MMEPFLLVHGSWFGGWCWRKVVPLLRSNGYEDYSPTLTGLGDRSHLAQPSIGPETTFRTSRPYASRSDIACSASRV